jgi:hypothetical protein
VRSIRIIASAALATLSVAAVPAAATAASVDAQVLAVYESTGSIPPCQFSAAELSHTLHGIDTFDLVYFADFPNAIKAALDQRASGACSGAAPTAGSGAAPTAGSGATPTAGSGATARVPLPQIPVTAATDGSLPVPMLLLALFAILCALGVAAAWLVRRTDPPWAAASRHSLAEAGYQLGGAWSRLSDGFSRSSRKRRG